MTRNRHNQPNDHDASSDAEDVGFEPGGGAFEAGASGLAGGPGMPGGRHLTAVSLLEAAIEPLVEDLGYELLLIEWAGAGKRRLMRLYIDSPAGVTIEDCSRLGRVLSNALDARETAAATGEQRDPVLAALLGKPYTLEISSPGVDRPLVRRRHFAEHVGGRVKIETLAPLEPDLSSRPSGPGGPEKKFHGRIAAVEPDPDAPDDQRRGTVLVHDADGDRTIRIPLPRIRRANLVWEPPTSG